MRDTVKLTMTIQYVKDWTIWEGIREFESNGKDAVKGMLDGKTSMEIIENCLVISDNGLAGLKLNHLLLGENEKSSTACIGQFGEGMKLALLVFTRMGMPVTINSYNLQLESGIGDLFGKEVLSITYDTEAELYQGTKVTIHNWNDNPTYSERFIEVNDNRIFCETENGDVIDETVQSLYEKDVFVTTLGGYLFGYNLRTAKMNRDRSVISESETQAGVASIWKLIDIPAMWDLLFSKIMSENSHEANMDLSFWNMEDKVAQAIKAGWYSAFGNNAVISTNITASKEAEHKGANPIQIQLGYYFMGCMSQIVETDKAYVARLADESIQFLSKHDLDTKQRKTYAWLLKQAKRMDFEEDKILLAKVPDSMGMADRNNGTILLHPDNFYSMKDSLRTMIHEIAHIFSNASDLTDDHVNMVAILGARLAMSYMPASERFMDTGKPCKPAKQDYIKAQVTW